MLDRQNGKYPAFPSGNYTANVFAISVNDSSFGVPLSTAIVTSFQTQIPQFVLCHVSRKFHSRHDAKSGCRIFSLTNFWSSSRRLELVRALKDEGGLSQHDCDALEIISKSIKNVSMSRT